jgi:hypothetical protein
VQQDAGSAEPTDDAAGHEAEWTGGNAASWVVRSRDGSLDATGRERAAAVDSAGDEAAAVGAGVLDWGPSGPLSLLENAIYSGGAADSVPI